jgi:hypothetical protein
VCLEVRDRQEAQDCRVIESQMPLVSAHAMSLTLLELWSLVQPEESQHKQGKYILLTGMLLLVVSESELLCMSALRSGPARTYTLTLSQKSYAHT